eukprot:10674280-Alexandrium_andersonii.AAC.1
MSASLVGSEMCIRDSLLVRGESLRLTLRARTGRQLQASVRRGARRRSAPVSYTHLTLPTICSV